MGFVGRMEALARRHHAGQLRKDGRTPYFAHPKAVFSLLEGLPDEEGFDRELMLAVAWGHDLLEDTGVSEDEIRTVDSVAGAKVLAGIRQLTFLRHGLPEPADKAARKEEYISRVAREAPPEILAVKIGDRLCNARDFLSLEGAGREKADGYLAEGEALHRALPRLPARIRAALARKWDEVAGLVNPSAGNPTE